MAYGLKIDAIRHFFYTITPKYDKHYDTKDRLMEFIRYKGLNATDFQRICGLGNGYVSKINDSIGKRGISEISRTFPDLNVDWLLYGEGEMLKPQPSVTQIAGDNNSNVNINGTQNAFDALLKVVETYQEQINRLITIIEKKL